MMFVGQEMLRHLGLSNRRADDAVTPQADLQAIPIHRVTPEDVSQRPKGDSERTQEQGVAYVIGPSRQVRHHEVGTDGVGSTVGLALDTAQAEPEFAGTPRILEGVA